MNTMMDSVHRGLGRQGLIRADRGRWLGGVCAGLAATMRTDPNAVRLIFVIALMILPGSQFLIYPLLWLVMPDQSRAAALLNPVAHPATESPAPAQTVSAEYPIDDQYPTNQQ